MGRSDGIGNIDTLPYRKCGLGRAMRRPSHGGKLVETAKNFEKSQDTRSKATAKRTHGDNESARKRRIDRNGSEKVESPGAEILYRVSKLGEMCKTCVGRKQSLCF